MAPRGFDAREPRRLAQGSDAEDRRRPAVKDNPVLEPVRAKEPVPAPLAHPFPPAPASIAQGLQERSGSPLVVGSVTRPTTRVGRGFRFPPHPSDKELRGDGMDAQSQVALTRALAEAEDRVGQTRAELLEARDAAIAAEANLRERRREEAERLRAFTSVMDAYEERLRLAAAIVPEGDGPSLEERLAALTGSDEEAGRLAYETDWYRVMLRLSQEP